MPWAVIALVFVAFGCGGDKPTSASVRAFGIRVGVASVAEVEAAAAARGFECERTVPASGPVRVRCDHPRDGRLLHTFDTLDAPVKLVASERTYLDATAARADYDETRARLARTFGQPTVAQPLPPPDRPWPKMRRVNVEWRGKQRGARLSAFAAGARITVSEEVFVAP